MLNKSTYPLVFFLFIFLPVINGRTVADVPEDSTATVIRELGLRESSVPSRDMPGWRKPKKILVTGATPETIALLTPVAGGAEIIGVADFFPQSMPVTEVDIVMGICRPVIMEAARHASWFHAYSAGVEACVRHPVLKENPDLIMTNNKGVASPSLAEHAITMAMMLERRMQIYINNQAQRKWAWEAVPRGTIRDLKGRTLLVAGLGGIGTQVALRAHALGMKVIATRNSSRRGPEYVEYVGLPDELPELAARADYVVNALPLTPETTGLFDGAFFRAMKNDAYFITVGRGKSVVTDDLVAALKAGELAGAGLDVTDPEPLPAEHPLWGMENVIITPHTGGITAGAGERRMVLVRENLRRYVGGEPLLNLVDIKKGY